MRPGPFVPLVIGTLPESKVTAYINKYILIFCHRK